MGRSITRRDFLNGAAIGAAGSLLAPELAAALEALARLPLSQQEAGYYPPALTGMRGSHDGSFEVAHRLRDERGWLASGESTGETYDLVVVGARAERPRRGVPVPEGGGCGRADPRSRQPRRLRRPRQAQRVPARRSAPASDTAAREPIYPVLPRSVKTPGRSSRKSASTPIGSTPHSTGSCTSRSVSSGALLRQGDFRRGSAGRGRGKASLGGVSRKDAALGGRTR